MKTTLNLDFDEAKDANLNSYSGRVCMFVLNTLRSDARVMRAASALSDAGFAVSVVDIVDKCPQTTEDIHGISVKHVKVASAFIATNSKLWAILKALLLFIRSTVYVVRTPADFYHAHDATALPTCYIAARLRGKLLIFDAHELPLSELDGSRRRWLRILLTPLLSHMLSSCAGGIGAAPFYEQNLRERYHIARVSLVRNVPPYRSVQKNDLLRQHLHLHSDTRIALYHGYLQYGRGLDGLVKAAAFLDPNIVIVMMGKGKGAGDASSHLKDLIAREKMEHRVKIIHHVQYEELLDWIVSADIGLITYQPDYSLNFQMCLPNKLFECLMAGLPVLTSSLDAVVEVFKTHNIGQILPSLAPEAIGVAINTMLADPAALASMRRNALDAAQNEYNWEKEKPKLIHLYNEMLTDRQSSERKRLMKSTLQHSWKVRLKHAIPPALLNTVLLRFPFLYQTRLVFYETTLITAGGIDELLSQLATVLSVEGEIIECGSSRCGASIIMAKYLQTKGVNKKILACDSFEGFDRVELKQEQKAGLTTATNKSFTSTSYQYVQKKIAALGFQNAVIPVKGYFQDTLPNLSGPFCLGLIDCDLKESLLYAAESIWPKLSPGGCLLFDDYHSLEFRGAMQGVDIFVTKHLAEISEHGLLNRLYYVRKMKTS